MVMLSVRKNIALSDSADGTFWRSALRADSGADLRDGKSKTPYLKEQTRTINFYHLKVLSDFSEGYPSPVPVRLVGFFHYPLYIGAVGESG